MDKSLFDIINTELLKKERLLIAIEGCCTSGKTTLAKVFDEIYDCEVIHMDDFFLPFEKKTVERMNEAGGNIDYERFFDEIVCKIRGNEAFSYGKFSCRTGKISESVEFIPKKLTVVEGVYSMHPKFGDLYDIRIFLDIDKKTQLERLKKRSPEKLDKFLSEWIPMENRYFDEFSIREKCNIVIKND